MKRVVIVGNGLAGHRLAERLARHGSKLTVTVLGAEPHAAYNRVLLSSVLAEGGDPARVMLAEPSVTIRLGARVVGIDACARTVTLADSAPDSEAGDLETAADAEVVGYDQLILATGSRPLLPPIPGLGLPDGTTAPGVVTFRTVEDTRRIAALAAQGPMAVVGGGLLGVEAARGLAGLGVEVTLVHPLPHLMERQLDSGAADVLARLLTGHGVQLRLDVAAVSWTPGALLLSDDTTLPVAGVVVTTGVAPQTWLARSAGLLVRRGIVVDDQLATSVPDIYAIGECAEHRGVCHGLVEPCWEQADVVADVVSGASPSARYNGSSIVTRLKARGIDLASMGELSAVADSGEPCEVIALSDASRGRYGTVRLREGRIVGAVLVGLPEATGPVIQLFDSRATVPGDRFGLLLGRAAGPTADSPALLPARALICRCNGVSKGELMTAWQSGARTVKSLTDRTRVTTGCGTCASAVEGICSWLADADPSVEQPSVSPAAGREGVA
ncbi:MAG: FAD-dependent oxidoreductase [Actinomycetota bacterium]|nr:FAD-dependent oxidoreductase [Actinomycetota bacterium]